MNVPSIGGARGIFEIFVPGVFLFLNVVWAAYLAPVTDQSARSAVLDIAANPALALVVVVSFGYLIGVLLRLFKTGVPDRLSAWWGRWMIRARPGAGKLWATEQFPFIGWIGEVCRLYLPSDVGRFYTGSWAKRSRPDGNKQYFNWVKVMVCSTNQKAAREIYAAESLSRYVASMFHALALAWLLIGAAAISQYASSRHVSEGLMLVLLAYFLCVLEIVAEFRLLRVKEVETVFAASYESRAIF